MDPNIYNSRFPTWCPGCGNWAIWSALKQACVKLGLSPSDFVTVFGIGCSGNMTDFVKSYGFHSLHGRAVPCAIGIKLANHKLPVIVVAGDGDCYGEGGNHLLHGARGNHDINLFIHDNRVYGLTTGQVSPTASQGFKSKSTPSGIIESNFNPLALAITQGATFVAQGFAGDIAHTSQLMIEAITHKGFSLLNILQPCVTFNKINTYEYYRQNTYKLDQNYNKSDISKALLTVINNPKIPLGVIYQINKLTYQDNLPQLKTGVLLNNKQDINNLKNIFQEFI